MLAEKLKLIKPGEVRTRFAPSPTGLLHVGAARTALFNYLFAKKNEGSFILRIEDTDKERSSPEFEKDILESLNWLGVEWDEFYRQSERLEVYAKYLKKLLEENKAYYCFCSEEELNGQRQYQMSQGIAPHYTGKCANLDKETIKKYLNRKKPAVIRFRVQAKKVDFVDLIRGKLEFDTGLMGDMVIAKDLNTPLYNFAVVVDDFEMKISHVIRAEEHISNTPKQILLQEALIFFEPLYAHLPLILATDRTKLSKRHGATSVLEFKKEGYLPESLINFMAFLGWNPGDEGKEAKASSSHFAGAREGKEAKASSSHFAGARDREIYSLPSLVKEFSLEKAQKSGAIFNIKKLNFLNGFYIRQKSTEKLTELCLPYLIESGLIKKEVINGEEDKSSSSHFAGARDFEVLTKIVSIYQERLKKLSEITELIDFFFKENLDYDKSLLKWKEMSEKEIKDSLHTSKKLLSKIKTENWNKESLENTLLPEAEKRGDRGYLLWPLRAALTGKEASASPFEVAEVLGKEKTLKRIEKAKEVC